MPTKKPARKRARRPAPDSDCCDCVAREPDPVPPYVARTAAGRQVDEGKDPGALARRCEDHRHDAGAVDVVIGDSRGRVVCVVQKNGGAYWLP
jgi:hypothetical protein